MKQIFTLFATAAIALFCGCQKGGDQVEADGPLRLVEFVPQAAGGAATIDGMTDLKASLNFELTPKQRAADLATGWKQALTLTAQCEGQNIVLAITKCRVSASTGMIALTASGSNMPEAFLAGSVTATAVLTVKVGENSVSSAPFSLVRGKTIDDYNGFQKFPQQNELKVMSFNVRVESSESDPANNWSNRKASCIELIKDHKPCIIGFQEAKYTSQWSFFKEQLKDEYDGYGVNRDNGKESGSGEVMGILYNRSKIEKLDGGTFWLSDTPNQVSYGWDAECRRTATWGVFKHKPTGVSFLYINTHLDHKGTQARIKGLEQIARFCGSYSALPIISGDMNIESTNEAFTALTSAMMKNTRDAAPKGQTDNNPTYNAYTINGQSVIDHIYCYKTYEVVEYHTVNERYGTAPYVSDHYPIYAIIKLL